MILMQTLALTTALVFATSLNAFFQLTVALMILVVGLTILPQCQPFQAPLSQRIQVTAEA